jgi:hypothetical protein
LREKIRINNSNKRDLSSPDAFADIFKRICNWSLFINHAVTIPKGGAAAALAAAAATVAHSESLGGLSPPRRASGVRLTGFGRELGDGYGTEQNDRFLPEYNFFCFISVTNSKKMVPLKLKMNPPPPRVLCGCGIISIIMSAGHSASSAKHADAVMQRAGC